MNAQATTLEQIREQGLTVLRKHLGIVGMVRFLQQSEMGWGNYTEERYQWLGDPDLEELAKKIQMSRPDRQNLTLMRPPVVKGQRYPLSGFLRFFPPGGCQHCWQSTACPDLISHAGAPEWLHHTPLEVRSPCL